MPPNQPEERRERCRGCGGAGRALTKRAWIIPKKPEGRIKTNEKARKNKQRCRVRGRVDAFASERHGPIGTVREAESALCEKIGTWKHLRGET